MHLTRREVCASASHRPLTDRHGRPSSVWARSLPCQPPGGTGVARCAAGQRPALPLSTGCVCWVALGSCGIAAPGPWSPGRARRLRGWGGGGGGRRRWDRRPWARQPALGAQIGEGAPLGPRGAALRQRVAAWSSLGAVGAPRGLAAAHAASPATRLIAEVYTIGKSVCSSLAPWLGLGSGLGLGLGLADPNPDPKPNRARRRGRRSCRRPRPGRRPACRSC